VGLLRAIQFCHERRVQHRDVKPDNLMVEPDGSKVVLIDFNSAVMAGARDVADLLAGGLTPTGTTGAMEHVAPELLSFRSAGELVDLWGAGICLYFMLAGKLPKNQNDMSEPIPLPPSSEDAQQLMAGLLLPSPVSRWMAKEALFHPWCELSEADIDVLSRGRQVAVLKDRSDGRGYHTPEPISPTGASSPWNQGRRSSSQPLFEFKSARKSASKFTSEMSNISHPEKL